MTRKSPRKIVSISSIAGILLAIFFLTVSVQPTNAQAPAAGQFAGYPTKFAETDAEFIQEFGDFLRKTKLVEVEKSATEFGEMWSSGKLNPEQKQACMGLFNTMLKKKYKPSPHFEKVVDMLIMAGTKRNLEAQPMLKLITTTQKVMGNFEPNPAFAYVANIFLYFKFNMLYTNGFYKLKVSKPGKLNFDWVGPDISADTGAPKTDEQVSNKAFQDWEQETAPAGSLDVPAIDPQYQEVPVDLPQIAGPVILFEEVSLKFETGFDSAALRKTKGTYMIANGTFVGDGGVMDWLTAGLKRSDVYANLKKYSFRVKSPQIQADNVMLFYANRLTTTVLGAFEWKSKRKTTFDEAVYPRFKSYYNESQFKDIKDEGILYKGGFSMEGRKVNSSSVFGGKGMIKLKNKNNWAISMVSNRFDFNDTTITSNSAYTVVYYGNDSIVHPAVRVVYNTVRREIRLYKEKGKFKDCPFYDSGHNMEIMTDLLVWDMDKTNMDFYITTGKTKVPGLFESLDFFTNKRFSAIQGIYTFHPLMMLQGYAKKAGREEFNVEEMAADFKQNANSLRSAMVSVAASGYIDYDEKNGNIKIREKLFHYTNSQKNKKDYDQLSIPSLNPSRFNAQLATDTSDITVYGVDRFFLSDSLNVYVEPKDKKVTIKGNRNLMFNGKLNAGNYRAYGEKFKFDYNEFKIEMGAIDSMEITTPSAKKDGKPTVSRMYGQDKNAAGGENALGNGTLYINEPDNKSSKKRIPKYPIFDIKTPSYIYFDKVEYLKGKYGSKVFFKIPPFLVDSASVGTAKSIGFDGSFVSDSIFPTFAEKLKIRPDKSLGFSHKTPPEGYPLYGTDARFFGVITMDFKGLRGKGDIKYLNATVTSEDFIFYPDSVIARGRSAKMEGTIIADVAFPECSMESYAMKWNPKKKTMNFINAKGMPFKLYNKTISLEGLVSLSPNGLAGRGYIQMQGARAESERYKFGKDGFSGRKAFFEVKSNNPIKPAVACRNVRFDFSFVDQKADFSPEVKGYASNVFPFCQYKTSIPKATWWIERKQVTMTKPDSIELRSSYFVSTKKGDSLYFNANAGLYDINTHQMTVSGIPYIHVADAEIKPDSGIAIISEGANLKTLKNATVLVDRTNKYHILKNANIKIIDRNKFEGDGIYQYVNALKDTISIKFDEFTLIDPLADKKVKVDTDEPYTVSGGEIPETKPIKLAQGILFKGDAFMSALKPNLEFKGQIKLDLRNNKNAGWVNYQTDGESKEFVLNVANATDDEGQPLISGLLIEDGSNKLYNSFLGPKHNLEDRVIFKATGILNYIEKTREFRIGSQDRFDEKTYEGGILVYNDSLSKISVTGKLDFQGAPDKDFVMHGAGAGLGLLDSTKFSLNASLALDFNMPAPAWKNMGTILAARTTDLGLAEAIDDKTALAYRLADMAGDKFGKDYEKQNQTKNTPIFTAVPKFGKSLFLSNVTLNWNQKQRAWYSTGKIGVSHVQGTNVNGMMEGLVEIKYTGGSPIVNVFLEPSTDGWYYISYDDTKRMAIRSAQDDFNTAIESKMKEGKEGVYYFTLAESYEKNRFVKAFKKNYLGIDVGEVVEEKPETEEKEKKEEASSEEEEEAPKPKPKKEKKKKKEEASEEEDEEAKPKPKKEEEDEEGFGDTEKPKEKEKPKEEEEEGFGDTEKPKEKPKEEEKPKEAEEGLEDTDKAKPASDSTQAGEDADKEKSKKKKKEKKKPAEEEPKADEPNKDEKKEEEGF